MKKVMNAFLLALLFPLQACAMQYSAEAIEARVVDAETNRPLEGVIVVAHWQLEGGLEGSNNLGQMMVMEAVTDAQGRFHFAAWGPKLIPVGLLANPLSANARLKDKDPELLLFKRDYAPRVLSNNRTLGQMQYATPVSRGSDWSGKTIKLDRSKTTEEQYVQRLSSFDIDMGCSYRGKEGEWKHTPRMIVALHYEQMRLKEAGIYNGLQSIDTMDTYAKEVCGTPQEFLKRYMK